MANSVPCQYVVVITMLFDTHCHLDFDSFGEDLSEILERAQNSGVSRILTIGAGRGADHAQSAIDIARSNPEWICASVGVHPHDAEGCSERLFEDMKKLAVDSQVVAIGEVGLDYYYEHSPKEVQKEVFRSFIHLAKHVRKPLIVHTRNAREDTLKILEEENAKDVGGIIHCFSEDVSFARSALDLGFVCSFSGIVTFKNAVAIQEAAAFVPDDSILIETDAPFLAPVPHRGKRNEPAFVKHTAQAIAKLRSSDMETIADMTTRNGLRVLKWHA